jgi:hypothetical protein
VSYYLNLRECTANSKSCCTISINWATFGWALTLGVAGAKHIIVWFSSTLAKGKKAKDFKMSILLIFTLSHPYLFGKVTTLNNENISEKKSNIISSDCWLYTEYTVYLAFSSKLWLVKTVGMCPPPLNSLLHFACCPMKLRNNLTCITQPCIHTYRNRNGLWQPPWCQILKQSCQEPGCLWL